MPKMSSIQWNALFLLVTFTASFTVFCHCTCTAAVVRARVCHSCCHKSPETPQKACQGMQAVRLNLQERQTAHPILPAPVPLTAILTRLVPIQATALIEAETNKLPQQWSYKHSPPNRLSFYQCFLI